MPTASQLVIQWNKELSWSGWQHLRAMALRKHTILPGAVRGHVRSHAEIYEHVRPRREGPPPGTEARSAAEGDERLRFDWRGQRQKPAASKTHLLHLCLQSGCNEKQPSLAWRPTSWHYVGGRRTGETSLLSSETACAGITPQRERITE
jgi:hypothetical protein